MYVGIDIVHDFLFFSVASDLIGSAVVSFDISPSVVEVIIHISASYYFCTWLSFKAVVSLENIQIRRYA